MVSCSGRPERRHLHHVPSMSDLPCAVRSLIRQDVAEVRAGFGRKMKGSAFTSQFVSR